MKKEKIFLDKSFLSGILICCFGGYMAAVTKTARGIYPLTVFVLMIVIGAFLMVGTIRSGPRGLLERISLKEMVLIALLFLNPLLAEKLGFYGSGYLVIAGVSWLIAPEKNAKTLTGVLVYSLVVAVAAYGVFTLLLKISTPAGILR